MLFPMHSQALQRAVVTLHLQFWFLSGTQLLSKGISNSSIQVSSRFYHLHLLPSPLKLCHHHHSFIAVLVPVGYTANLLIYLISIHTVYLGVLPTVPYSISTATLQLPSQFHAEASPSVPLYRESYQFNGLNI